MSVKPSGIFNMWNTVPQTEPQTKEDCNQGSSGSEAADQGKNVVTPVTPEITSLDREIKEQDSEEFVEPEPSPLPYLKDGCELVTPLSAPDRYRWWQSGQSIFETLLELDAPNSVVEDYIGLITSPADCRRWQKIRESRIAARPIGGKWRNK